MLTIRKEIADDIPAIRTVTEAAFKRPAEAGLVDALRLSGALALSVVAMIDDRVVGHLALSPVVVESADSSRTALALAPVSVAPDFQRQGIGSALIRWSLDECRKTGHPIVIVLGHTGYYPRFGFVPASEHGILCPFPLHDSGAFMVARLTPSALVGCAGTVKYHPEFAKV